MTHSFDVRKVPALALACLLVALSAVVPILDRDAGHERPAFEPGGAEATCMVGHDHGICIQHGANPLAPTLVDPPEHVTPVRATPAPPRDIVFRRSFHIALRPSRAPPAA
ncbi:MAG TPA: hypothetical protein VF212_04015 [Longimicrobiales bacterium]